MLFAENTLLSILGLLFIFHILVLFGVIPYNIVWAGKIKNRKEMIIMESISLLILMIAALIVALKAGHLTFLQNIAMINVGMWVLFAFFTLNTFGNLTAKNRFEKYGFGLLTFIISLLVLWIIIT